MTYKGVEQNEDIEGLPETYDKSILVHVMTVTQEGITSASVEPGLSRCYFTVFPGTVPALRRLLCFAAFSYMSIITMPLLVTSLAKGESYDDPGANERPPQIGVCLSFYVCIKPTQIEKQQNIEYTLLDILSWGPFP